MIWFSCGKCGKTHGRPENAAGSLVFCECGNGNRVPWESTATEPPPQVPMLGPSTPSSSVPAPPTLAPLTFDLPASPTSRRDRDEEPIRRRRGEPRDPNFCFNHPSTAQNGVCEDCGEAFCSSCLVTMAGATVCGPCKNFRARTLEQPAKSSGTAVASVIIALMAGGVLGFCLLPFGGRPAIMVLSILALVPQLFALGLGIRSLFVAEAQGRPAGQALAITGIAAAGVTILLTVMMNLYGLRA
jgi:hypothetical protein